MQLDFGMVEVLKRFGLVVLVLAASACAKPEMGMSPDIQMLRQTDLPAPTRADQVAVARPYLVGPFDKLKIDVFGVEDLEKEVQTDASGKFSFPLIGTVEAAGSTPGEISDQIEGRLTRYIRNPQVTVNLIDTVSQVITVEGEVNKPGLYPVVGNMTLVRAVATAGGVGELAQLEDVVVFRQVNGQRYAGLYSLKAIRAGNYVDPPVYANDVVIVGQSSARRLFRDILAATPILTTPIVVLANGS
ncbi:polysaccharide biosynthesis/export family protein [Tsuneonella sp. HG249]